MGTTYTRIRQVLYYLEGHPDERQLDTIARNIRLSGIAEFHLRSSDGEMMSEASIRRLIRFMDELDLIKLENGELRNKSSFAYARNDDTYAKIIDMKAQALLSARGVTIDDIGKAIRKVKLPSAPDAPTLYEKISPSDMSEETFRRLLYLLARAGRAMDRSIRVHYHVVPSINQ